MYHLHLILSFCNRSNSSLNGLCDAYAMILTFRMPCIPMHSIPTNAWLPPSDTRNLHSLYFYALMLYCTPLIAVFYLLYVRNMAILSLCLPIVSLWRHNILNIYRGTILPSLPMYTLYTFWLISLIGYEPIQS